MGTLDGGYTFTSNLTEPGIIQLGIGSNSANLFSESGMIAQITFESIGELGEFSSLTFLDAQINSIDKLDSAVNGSISIEIILDELILTGQDNSEIGADHVIKLGMCEGCTDDWKFGEDEDDYPNPPGDTTRYTNIHFYHLDWYGQKDKNGIVCNQYEFSTDFRSQHSFRELTSWGIRGSTSAGIPSDVQINLSWDATALDIGFDNFQSFIFVGDEDGEDMQQQSNITISQSDLDLNEFGEPNIRIKLGICADTGEAITYYKDFDGDGLGSGISAEYCVGYVLDGWVTNSEDLDDYCFSNVYDCAVVCDGSAVLDCADVCDGSAVLDCADECGGSAVLDCADECGGSAVLDVCGECVGGNTGNHACPYDCLGIPDGTAAIDNCGNCDNDSSNDCVQDCAGEWGGNLVLDECDVCGGLGPTSNCGCTDIPDGDCDCNGNTLDECMVCGGDSSSCTDCAEVINGTAYTDGCGECVGGNTGNDECPYDCLGIPDGTATIDNCENCDNDSSNDCVQDCAGEWGGNLVLDACGICGGSGIPEGDCDCEGNIEDCGKVCGGGAIIDDCGECVGVEVDYFNENMDICGECEGIGIIEGKCDCAGHVLDCAGECGGSAINDNCGFCNNYEAQPEYPYGNCDCIGNTNGTATIDNCGTCDDDSSNDCIFDCNGVQNGDTVFDNCGVCDNDSSNDCVQDCAGIWGGTAIFDENCGICVGGNTGTDCAQDCVGTWNGKFWDSDCGCVGPDNSGDECDDCAENPNGSAELDLCGNCIDNETDSNITCDPDCDGIYGGNHPPTFTCQNGNIACNFDACFNLANDDLLLPLRFDISRIYPNPFNPSATIDFEVSEPTMVQLNIYNLKGQKVNVLKNAFTLPGHYSVIWNGTNHPSGLYFVILHSSKSIVKQKMMLIK